MFSKKICPRCGEKNSKNHSFCHNCGIQLKEKDHKKEWGMIGTDDNVGFEDTEIKLPLGFNKIFNALVKNIDKQFKELDKEMKNQNNPNSKNEIKKSRGIKINFSAGNGKAPKIFVKTFGDFPNIKNQEEPEKVENKKMPSKNFSNENIKRLSKLPRKEPQTNIRKFSDKLIYEIDVPGVNKEEDVSIIQLENSIEVKAIGKKEAYFKLIPINLPITGYKLSKGKLTLELSEEND